MRNPALLIFSLALATLLSLYVQNESNFTAAKVFIGVELRDAPSGKVVRWQPSQVEIEVRGPQHLVSRVLASPPTLRIHLPDEVGPRFVKTIDRTDFQIAPPVQVVSIDPQRVEFRVEERIERQIPVRVSRLGSSPEGVRIQEINVEPSSVTVSGPESEVKDLTRIESYPLDVREISRTSTVEVNLRPPGKYSEIATSSVRATVKVVEVREPKTVGSLPVEVRGVPGVSANVFPAEVSVTVEGDRASLEKLRRDEVVPFVRLSGPVRSGDSLRVQVDVPDALTVSSIEPREVKVVGPSPKKKR